MIGVGHTGNQRRSKSVTLTVNVAAAPDTTAPVITAITPSNVDYNGTHVDASFNLSASITEANTLSSCQYQVNGGAWTNATVGGAAPNWTCTVTGGLGPYADTTALALNFRGTDNSANVGTGVAVNRTVDAAAPSTTDNAPAGWQANDVTVTLTPTDTGSGVASTQYCVDTANTCTPGTSGTSVSVTQAAGTAGAQYVRYRSTDNVGNIETTKSATVQIDKALPSTTDNTPAGWQANDVTVSLTPTDTGSGVASTQYCVDITNTCTPSTSGTSAGVTQAASTAGTQYVRYRSTDNVGNVENTKSATVQIDKKGPVDGSLTVTPSDSQNLLSWTAASDPESGLRTGSIYDLRYLTGASSPADCASGTSIYTGDNLTYTHTPITNGTQYSYRICAYDALNNGSTGATGSGTPTAGGDTTPPTVTSTTPTNGATGVTLNSQVTINFSENIDCTTVNTTTITSTSPGWSLSGCAGSTATFNTSGQANSTGYSVNVTTNVKDPAGNAMSAAYPFSYTTAVAGPDAVIPKVISFLAISPVATSVNIPVTVFTATDNVGVTGYMITASSTPPNAGDAGWSGTVPTTYTASAGDGTKTLYPWVKDGTGNVSALFGTPASVVVDGTGPTDGTLTVTAGDTLNSLSWTAATDAGVGLRTTNRYDVRFAAGATAPADCAAGTSLYTGSNLSFSHTGLTNGSQYSYRVCAYDALNNVSTGKTGSGTPAVANTPTLSGTTVKWITPGKVSSAKTATATLAATLNVAGTSAITARGIVWSTTNTNPTIGGAGVTAVAGTGTALGEFTVSATGLPIASQVYFQGYATNSSGTSYSGPVSFWTEPTTSAAPTVNAIIPGENYFDLTVNYPAKPANADGLLIVVRQSLAPKTPPYDGALYTANPRIGSGSPTDPNCMIYCEYVVADITAAAAGSVTVTGLKAGLSHYFTVYAYKGTGTGLSGINYVQTINSAMQATAAVPLAGRSHNELWVATSSPKDGVSWGTMTSADCANCHGSHHTSQLLPTGVDMYDKCYTCHQDGGAADDNTVNAKINMALHLSDGSVDCGTCHSMHSFKTEELFSEDNQGNKGFNRAFIRKNMAKYFNTSNGFATNALEPTVFQNRPDDFANAAVDAPYNAVCQTCHTDVSRTPYHQQTGTTEHNVGTDCMTCHTHRNAAGKTGAFTPGGHDATHFPWDATTQASCGTLGCHDFAANPDVVGDVHGGVCSVCHSNPSGGDGTAKVGDATFGVDGSALLADPVNHTENCLVCHPAATYDRSTVHHTSKNGYATAGICTQCHTGTNYPGDHSARVSLATNCADCHNGTQGIASGIPVDATDATVAARKIHDACTTCHNTDDDATLRLPYGAAQVMPGSGTPSNDGGGTCEACHTAGFGGYHATVGHATTVNTYVNCSTCHTGTAGLATSIPTSVADNKVHDACATCHGADGRLVNIAAGKNGGTDGGSDAVNSCATCHGEYFSSHTNINHTTYVAVGGICGDCHTATAGTTTTVPVDGANNKKHDACSTCHQATGILNTFAQADTHNPDWITAMPAGGGTCLACHGDNFTTKTHSASHAAEFYYDTNGTGDDDILQANGSAGCAACHNDAGTSLASFAAINTEHTATSCDKCHKETRDINESAATGTTVRQWIAAREADAADTNCRTCHVPNWNNVPNHAGHNTSDFAWDATTQTSCGTVGCHDYVANPDVVANVHGGTCTICHSTAAGGDGTTKVGSATNGVDGDATLGSTTTPHGDNCLVCHDIADADVNAASIGGIHHDNKTDGTVIEGDCTTRCHTVTGFKGTHDTTVATTTNCSSCHSATAGDATGGVPVNAADGKVHDGCTTCHGITAIPAANSYLLAAYGKASAMPAGGGDCNACHGAYFTSHVNANHTVHVGDTTNCNTCHTATAGTTTTVPVDSGDNKVHDACATCHNTTNGNLLAVTAPGGSANIASGNCNACHGAYFPSHGNANHSTFVSLATNCADCHNGTQGTATTVPVNTGNNKVHDACADCHNTTTGALLAAYGAAQAIPVGGGSCETCHTSGFTGYHGTVSHAAMVAAYVNCSTCHTAYGNTVNPSDPKVHDACASCHGADGRLIGSASGNNGGTNGGTDGGGNCSVCHGEYFNSHTNANHTALVAGLATCTSCHIGTAGTSTTVPISGVDHKLHDSCSTCHQATGALVTFPTANGWTTAMPDGGAGSNNGGGDCGACHGTAYFDSHVHGRDTAGYVTHDLTHNTITDLSQNPGQPCRNCHNGNNADGDGTALNSWRDIKSEHLGSCAICHSYTNADGQGTPPLTTNDTVIASGTGNKCLSCHTPKAAPATHGGHKNTDFAWSPSCGTSDCHDSANNPDIVSDVHGGTGTITSPLFAELGNGCQNCHSSSSGGDGTTIGGNLVNGYVGNATGADPANHTEACIDCHTGTIPQIHHYRDLTNASGRNLTPTVPSRVQSGNCHLCHTDGTGTNAHGNTNVTGKRPKVTCTGCHVENDGTSFKIKKFDLTRITGSNAFSDSPDPFTGTYTHVIPNLGTPIIIQDSGVCFYCHGQSTNRPANYGTTPVQVVPFHGFINGMNMRDESVTANDPRLTMALHPGHIKYHLKATTANVQAITKAGTNGSPMNNRNGTWNDKLYKNTPFTSAGGTADAYGKFPVDIGHNGGIVASRTKFYSVWALKITNELRDCKGDCFAPVATVSIPNTINGGPAVNVPATP